MRLAAQAKVNWTLAVLGRRPDGYHLLDMALQSVSLCDMVELSPANTLSLTLLGKRNVPPGEGNLALRAAKALRDACGVRAGAAIRLDKRIPVGAGLGGGSADAAAVLLGLNRLWSLNLTGEALCELALTLGADVPFCLTGGLARVRGIGEAVEPRPCATPMELVIVHPCKGLSTPAVFQAYDALPEKPKNPSVEAALQALAAGDASALAASMGNALHAAALPLRPEIAQCAQALEHHGALRAQMTGSGSAVIGLFGSASAAADAQRACGRIWPKCVRARTLSHGVSMFST